MGYYILAAYSVERVLKKASPQYVRSIKKRYPFAVAIAKVTAVVVAKQRKDGDSRPIYK